MNIFNFFRCKRIATENQNLKNYYKDILLKNMSIELETVNSKETTESKRTQNIVFYVGGYLVLRLKRRKSTSRGCEECLKTVQCSSLDEYDESFSAHEFTQLKNRGGLRLASIPLFSLLQQVESVIQTFSRRGTVFDENAFESILHAVCVEKLSPVGCSLHRDQLTMNMIYDYILMRFLAKQKKRELCAKQQNKKHAHRKMSKLPNT